MKIQTSHMSTCFWGARSGKEFSENVKSLIWDEFGGLNNVFMGDNLITIGRNLSFLQDQDFMRAYGDVISSENVPGQGIIWRLYTFCWAAKASLRRNGDFVECGVSTATSSKIMVRYLSFEKVEKKLWLYDVFGVDNRIDTSVYFGRDNSALDEVKSQFAPFSNVNIIPGFIPESFSKGTPEAISFLHIDLNNVDAEIATLNALFDRVVPGGIILFDDYGATGFHAQKIAEDNWLLERNHMVLELPTGQGLVIKS